MMCSSRGLSDPHHVNPKGHGGKGTKASDDRAIPLCHAHHVEYHNIGRDSFAKKYTVDYEAKIEAYKRLYMLMILKEEE